MVLDNRGKELQIVTSNTAKFELPLRFENDGVPVSQTGNDFLLQVRERANTNSRLILELSTDNGRITVDGARVILLVEAADMKIAAGTYYYTCNTIEVADATNITQQFYGQFTIVEGVTK
jgi:hypothetical protein